MSRFPTAVFLASLIGWVGIARADYDPPLIPEPIATDPVGTVVSSSNIANDSALNPLVVPAYHSDQGAPASLYLDFTGDNNNTNWGGYDPGQTPAYDSDGDPTTFSNTELANISEIYQRVAEKYSPFNIDVTTQEPSDLSHGKTAEIVIGGTGSWYQLAGGVSWVGAFSAGSNLPNVSYVFSDNLSISHPGTPKYVAEAISHEAGHQFGLYHQSDFSGSVLVNEYSFGTYNFNPNISPQLVEAGSTSPVMGDSYYADRGLWWSGTSDQNGVNRQQNDMSVIASGNNGFGYRPEPSNTSFATAAPMTIGGTGFLQAQGIIIHPTDRDYFSFQSSGGLVSFLVNVAPYGAMLDASAQIYDLNGNLMAQSITPSLSELVAATLPAGSYDLVVSSAGNYGDVGQYFVTGSLGTLVPEPGIAGLMVGGMIFLRRKRA